MIYFPKWWLHIQSHNYRRSDTVITTVITTVVFVTSKYNL